MEQQDDNVAVLELAAEENGQEHGGDGTGRRNDAAYRVIRMR